jgi:2-keto-4-pentenoate hydratase
MGIAIQGAVERVLESRSELRPLAPFSESAAGFSLAEAYTIQDALRADFLRRGEPPIGWKLGATSAAGQQVMGLNEPACGFLLPTCHKNGASVSVGDYVNLRIEAEIVFRMRTRLAGPGATAASALAAIDGVAAALELLDFSYSGKPRGADFVANTIVAKAIAVGDSFKPAQSIDLAAEGVVYEHNGEIVGTYTSAEVMGNPVNALVWLANHLPSRGFALEPGDLVMAGAISKMVQPKAGDTVRARFAHLGPVGVTIAP